MYNYDTLNDFITSISACINAYLCTLTGIMLIYDDFHHLIRRKTTGILMETLQSFYQWLNYWYLGIPCF